MKDIAILWDLDGTLLDTLEDLHDATNHVLEQFGCRRRSLEEVRRFVGNGARRLMVQALPGREDDPGEDAALAAFQAYYSTHCRIKTKPYDGIVDALKKLGEEYHLAIVSNKPDVAVKPLCADFFPGLYAQGETDGCPRKPAPDMVLRAAEVLGVKPGRCIYVGDSEVDVLTAKNAGMVCLSVLWGFRDEAVLRANGAEHFCGDPHDLPRKIKELENFIHGK